MVLDRIFQLPRVGTRRRKEDVITLADHARDARQWHLAARLYREALDHNPRNPPIWVQYGHTLKEWGELRDPEKLAQAEIAYRRALALDPVVADTYLQLGHILKLQGKSDEAEASYLRAFALDPASPFAQQELSGRGWSETHLAELKQLMCPAAAPTAVDRSVAGDPRKKLSDAAGDEPAPVRSERVGVLDYIYGTTAAGWVWNPRDPTSSASVEFVVSKKVIHRVEANIYRDDLKAAGFGTGCAGFLTALPITVDDGEVVVHARLADTNWALDNSPRTAKQLNRCERVAGEFRARLRARLDRETQGLMSVVMPVYNTDAVWLREAIESVTKQWCSRWELVCVNNGSTEPHVWKILDEYARSDNRINVVTLFKNAGIAGGTNAGIQASSGELIAFMDSDDYLEPDTVYKYLRAHHTTKADLLYCDEFITGSDSNLILSVAARAAYSWDYYISHPYFVHMISVSRRLINSVGKWNESMQQSADVDFVLRCQEHAKLVAHIPSVLYRWRTHAASWGHQKKEDVTAATLAALNRHLARTAPGAVAIAGPSFNFYRVDFPDDHGKVLIVIQVLNGTDFLQRCLDSIWATTQTAEVEILIVHNESCQIENNEYLDRIKNKVTTHTLAGDSNYCTMFNSAVKFYEERYGHLPPYLLFSSDAVEARESGWLDHMRGLSGRDDVGVVGATLIHPDDRIHHAGVVIGLNGAAAHINELLPFRTGTDRTLGHLGNLVSTRDYSAVGAGCIMSRAAVFAEADGFGEGIPEGLSGVDYCLRVGSLGYKVLNDAHAVLRWHEPANIGQAGRIDYPEDYKPFLQRWENVIDQGDPYYSPLFYTRGPQHEVARYASASSKVTVKPGLGSRNRVPSSPVKGAIFDVRKWQTEVKLTSPSPVSMNRPIGIFVHIFYDELTDEIASYLAQIDLPKRIYISTKPAEKTKTILAGFDRHGLGQVTDVAVVPDYGTDIAPLVIAFADKIEQHDVCLKIHSKRSVHAAREFGDGWRSHLYHELMANRDRVCAIVNTMLINPDVGMLIPRHYPRINVNSISIGVNYDQMQRVLTKIGIHLLPNQDIEYPVGSMFWFRGKALAALAHLGFDWADFGRGYEETDGTLAHGMERCFLFFVAKAGMKWGFLPPFRSGPAMSRDEAIRVVRDSGLFDEAYYLKANPDIAGAGIDPLGHWVDFGSREWRNPSESFDLEFYTRLMPPQYFNAIVHYMAEGRALGLPTVRPSRPYPFEPK
jgi:GT2 family glycosyltransferase